jgi:hypothetical protein
MLECVLNKGRMPQRPRSVALLAEILTKMNT